MAISGHLGSSGHLGPSQAASVWTSLVEYPTLRVTLKDSALTIALTAGGGAWLLLSGMSHQEVFDGIEEEKKASRGQVWLSQ